MIKLIITEGNEWVFCDENLQDFESHEELDRAIDMEHTGDYLAAENSFQKIIRKNPYHIDAYHHLSLLQERYSKEFDAYLCCREAVRIGLSAVPSGFSWKTSRLSWSHLDNRPFMRAYHNLGLWMKRRGETDEAVTIFTNLLAVNPNDNLGVRYLLPELWLSKGDLLSVIRHCKAHKDDCSPDIMYTYPLALILSGEVEKAKRLLSKAKSNFPLFAKELKKKRHSKPKPQFPGSITFGGADHAYEYWESYGEYWTDSPQTMSLL